MSKLQHRNLVRLLECCLQEEKLLSPLSMNVWIGRSTSIIKAISRGLVYLHKDSRLRIIHRDLKESNMLDGNLIALIFEFGMVLMFGGSEPISSLVLCLWSKNTSLQLPSAATRVL